MVSQGWNWPATARTKHLTGDDNTEQMRDMDMGQKETNTGNDKDLERHEIEMSGIVHNIKTYHTY